MGFYIQDDMFESVADLSVKEQNEIMGTLVRLYFTGDYGVELKGTSKALVTSFRDRVLISRKKSKTWEEKKLSTEIQPRVQPEVQPTVQTPSSIKEREREREDIPNGISKEKEEEREEIPFAEIIGYLNERTRKRFRVTDQHKRHISARWKEGYRLDDFKAVIDKKAAKWDKPPEPNGTATREWLRPETLFGTKFDSYLNEDVELRGCDDAEFGEYNEAF